MEHFTYWFGLLFMVVGYGYTALYVWSYWDYEDLSPVGQVIHDLSGGFWGIFPFRYLIAGTAGLILFTF